jgi:hypothetical protein
MNLVDKLEEQDDIGGTQGEDIADEHMNELSEQIGAELNGDDEVLRYLMPFYMEALGPKDVHKVGKYSTHQSYGDSARGKPRGGYSVIGYNPLLPKDEAIAEMRNKLFKMLSGDRGVLYDVKMDEPIDMDRSSFSEREDVDPQRDWPEEFVSPRINPHTELHDSGDYDWSTLHNILPTEEQLYEQIGEELTFTPRADRNEVEARNRANNIAWLKSKEGAAALRKFGLSPRAIQAVRGTYETEVNRTPLWRVVPLQRSIETLVYLQEADQLAQDYYRRKNSVSDEELKDIG